MSQDNYKWWALATVAIGTFMAPLDGSVVNIALPHIAEYFHTNLVTAEWVVMSYLLVISSLLLTYGRLGDMFGHKPVYLTGFIIFTLGSALCGFSTGIGMLITARVVQAIGAGMMMAIGPALITGTFPPTERGRALGLIGMTVAAALTIGPTIGGLLLNFAGWRFIFFINLPIGIGGTVWAAKVLRREQKTEKQRFDIPGAITVFLSLTALLLALSLGEAWGWSSWPILLLITTFVLTMALFIWLELKIPHPMIDLTLFKNRLFSMANISSLLNFMAQFSVVFLFPFYLETVRHLAPAKAGLIMSALPLAVLITAPVSGALSDRIGSRLLSSLGMGVMALSMFALSRISIATPYPYIALNLTVFGFGAGLFQSPNNSAIMGSVPKRHLGIASGILASMRNIGMVIGVALGGAVFSSRLPEHTAALKNLGYSGEILKAQAFVGAMQDSYLVAASLAGIGIITSLVRGAHAGEKSKG